MWAKGKFWELCGPVSVVQCVPLLQLTVMLPTGWCHITLSHVKNYPPPIVRCGLSSKFFDHQMYLLLDLSRTFYLLLLLRILNIFVHQCVYSNWSSNVIRWKSIRRRLAFSWRRTDLLLKRHWTVETNSMDSDFNCYLVACKSLYVLWPLFANWHCNMSSVKRFRLWLQTWNNAGDSLSFCYFCDYWGENSEEAC